MHEQTSRTGHVIAADDDQFASFRPEWPEETDAEDSASTLKNTLDVLLWDWGEAYEIEMPDADHYWRARRLDGLGGWIDADSAEDLRNQLVSDYVTKPVRKPSDPQREQEGSSAGKGQTMPDKTQDLTQLDDPAFLAERARVRELLIGDGPTDPAECWELSRRYQELNDEFFRRASAAWQQATPTRR